MPPTIHEPGAGTGNWLKAAARSAAPHIARASTAAVLSRRDLSSVNDAQKVTLGIIAAYVVAIALLWNLPYVRWVLWPFKVRFLPPASTLPYHSPEAC